MTTPCEELGYKVGDKFVVVDDNGGSNFEIGSIISLIRDDSSEVPLFKLLEGNCNFSIEGSSENYCSLYRLKKLYRDKDMNTNERIAKLEAELQALKAELNKQEECEPKQPDYDSWVGHLVHYGDIPNPLSDKCDVLEDYNGQTSRYPFYARSVEWGFASLYFGTQPINMKKYTGEGECPEDAFDKMVLVISGSDISTMFATDDDVKHDIDWEDVSHYCVLDIVLED